MSDWNEVSIGSLGRVVTGRTPPASAPEAFGSEYPFVTPTDMDGRRFIDRAERYVSPDGAKAMPRQLVPAMSVMVSCIGWQLGKAALTTRESFTNQQLNTVVPDPDLVDPTYLYYELSTRREEIRQLASGGTRTPILNKSRFEALIVRLPPRETQTAVASVLGSFDDLIENNRRRVEVLEEMVRAIYREWFVHFRFPGHEDVTFVDSDLGPIPEGWSVGTLGELVDEIRDPVKPSEQTAALPYVPIDVIDPKSVTLRGSKPGSEAASSLRLFSEGDVLFGAMRAYFHKVCVAPFDGVTRSTCFVLRPRPDRSGFAELTMATDEVVAYASAHSSGSTIPYAKWSGVLSEMSVVLPPGSVCAEFRTHVAPILQHARVLAESAQPLGRLRDSLLPKLVTGQIDVSDLDLDAVVEKAGV